MATDHRMIPVKKLNLLDPRVWNIIISIPKMYIGAPMQWSILLTGFLCVLLIAFIKLNCIVKIIDATI